MPLSSASSYLPNLEISQLQLPNSDLPCNPGLPAYVTHDWRIPWTGHRRIGAIGPRPPLPQAPDDLSLWTWRVPLAGADLELPIEVDEGGRRLRFYRRVSTGSASARITRPLNNGRYYWELRLGDRMFGTSIMVGIGGAGVRNHTATFKNLIGEDKMGWGLSHKGVLWHGGMWSPYTDPFPQNEPTTIGVLFDGIAGTLGFFKDGRWMGVAFTGLDKVTEPLYPIVSSTARNTKMTLLDARGELGSLMERCRASVLRGVSSRQSAPTALTALTARELVTHLPLPRPLLNYVIEGVVSPVSLPATNPAHRLLI